MAMLELMARAMAEELESQIRPQVRDYEAKVWGSEHAHFSQSGLFGTCQINGEVDLRAVARAGLMALRNDPNDAVLDAISGTRFSTLPPGKQQAERAAFAAAIDAMLN